MTTYLFHVLLGLDQLANTLLAGHADETLSARAWRVEQDGKVFGKIMRPAIDALAIVVTLGYDANHCRDSYESERKRKQLPTHYREN